MKSTILVLLATLFIVGCSAVKLTTPTQADVDRVSNDFTDYSLADLQAGQALFSIKCTKCHKTKDPTKKDAEGWSNTVARMVKKANKNETWINETEQQQILRYLVTMSGAPKGS